MMIDDQRAARIEANAKEILDRVRQAAVGAGRNPEDIAIVPIVKNQTMDDIRALADAGFMVMGENRVPEALEKMGAIQREVKWHLVGHLQRNKANKAVGRFDLIHSVESMDLVDKLSARSVNQGIVTRILIEVNISGEEAKYGIDPDKAIEFAHKAADRDGVRVLGFMGMGPLYGGDSAVRDSFKLLKNIFDRSAGIDSPGFGNEILSMGMTDDYEMAVAEGSTLLRIGRAFFK